ncbi:cuticle protein 1-like isoform X2 [Periplaneta americana]|uniref:cuticle protein 1-like isoform X2 n=1 Tax=Periplaneta americana TaxID=6978 RepID=UPI0037E80728
MHTTQQHPFNMTCKLVVLAAVVAVAVGGADKYPAGLNPALCPNYPHCDNVLLAQHSHSVHYAAPNHYGPYAAAGHYVPYAAAAHNLPAGVSPQSCPNYPYCSHYVPAATYQSRQYPAGVSPYTCPNYPYCH